MPIQETLEFESDKFRRVVATASTEWLRKEEVKAIRKGVLSSVGVSFGVSGAAATGGVSILYAAYKTRSSYVAWRKLEIIQSELRKRNVELHKISKSKDILGPVAIGTAGAIVGAEVADLFDAITGIDQVGGLPDDALPSTGLLDNPGEAVNGAAGAVEQIFDTITGDAGAAAAITTTDAVAYHAGMVQIQTIASELGQTAAETLLFAPGEPSLECRRGNGEIDLSCDNCKARIPQGRYWHCCGCQGDNYDICEGCYARNVRCKDSRHFMKRLQTPTRADFIDKMSNTPGYSIWKPKAGASILKSELEKRFLFHCNFCQAEVRQGKVFHCFECSDFDLCDECYLLGKRCKNLHNLASGLCAIDISDCPGYIRDDPASQPLAPRNCTSCRKPAYQGVFYRCHTCGDGSGYDPYSLCYDCYDSGYRCKKPSEHTLVLYLVSNNIFGTRYPSNCKRKWSSTRSFKKGGACTRCKAYITGGSFFHCCQCPGQWPDDFDMCMRCYRGGRHCFNTDHLLTRHYIK